jgi:ferredoxin
MLNEPLHLITFSPTLTTRSVVAAIGSGLSSGKAATIDLTPPQARTASFNKILSGIAIIGAPVYAGRIPPECVRRLARIQAADIPTVVVVLYGNRAYEDALIELRDLSLERGFRPIAGAAFIGEHSYSSRAKPIAAGRPDENDLAAAKTFGERVSQLLENSQPEIVQVPGNVPYKDYLGPSGVSPVTAHERCGLCGSCVVQCPTAAIRISVGPETNPDLCILCNACVKACPNNARFVDIPRVRQVTEWLYLNCQERKKPEYFLGEEGS